MIKRVVVTGSAGVSALGNSWDTAKKKIMGQENCVRHMNEWNVYSDLRTRLAAPIDGFTLPEHITIKKRRAMGRVAQFAAVATEEALKSAGLHNNPILKSGHVGIAYGSATGSSAAAMEFFSLLENYSTARVNGTTYLRMMSHTAPVNLSVLFGTTGRMYTTSSACTAGSQGIGYAFEAIKSGQQKVMIAGGCEELCPTQAAVFDAVYSASLKNKTPKLSPSPFSSHRDGLVLGEGAGTLILEDLEFAQSRGAPIIAEVVGFATNCDGTHMVRPNRKTMATVMKMSLASAGLHAEDIGYINGHGTSTILGDIAESIATEEVMGTDTPFSSIKSYIGHTLGACGAIEAWLGINMMNESWFAKNLNLDIVDERCGKLDYITGAERKKEIEYLMSNNFAFGGVNTSLIFKKVVQSSNQEI